MFLNKYILIGTSLLLAGCANSVKEKKNGTLADTAMHKEEFLTAVRTVPLTDSSWGYEILANGKIVIKQNFIPVIPGNHIFRTEEEAKKTGDRVIYNLKNKHTPVLDESDLKAIGIWDAIQYGK